MFEAVLFDLDGTLADTAPDLGGALNRLRAEEGLPPLPLAQLRPFASQGVRGLLHVGFRIAASDTHYERLSARFLELYAADLCSETTLFEGIAELLDGLNASAVAWGIVTNKRERFTNPLVAALGLAGRTNCIVSGDTTPAPKPSPLPVLYACQQLSCRPDRALFIGDDRRDIEAGKAAGTLTAAALYGYLGEDDFAHTWNADFIANHPADLTRIILNTK